MTNKCSWLTESQESWLQRLQRQGILNYRLILVAVLGIFFMVIGGYLDNKEDKEKKIEIKQAENNLGPVIGTSYEEVLENKLSVLFSQVQGAGKVVVSVSLENGMNQKHAKNIVKESKVVQEKDSVGTVRTTNEVKESEQVLFSKENGIEKPIIVNEVKPQIKGVLVIAQGAYDSKVKANLVKAVEIGLGIPAYKVTVLAHKQEVIK